MTRPLRRAHLRIWLVLAIVLPALFILALSARRGTTPINPGFHWEMYK
jgi:hypothetical protein